MREYLEDTMSASLPVIENAIGGKRTISQSEMRQPVFNPATGEEAAILPISTVEEVDAVVANAKSAQPEWGRTPPLKRARYMFKFKELLDRYADDLARGRPLLYTAEDRDNTLAERHQGRRRLYLPGQ
jgi:acyl-CoA reductase-like NAD-dependent aldehyde dehydrogenase